MTTGGPEVEAGFSELDGNRRALGRDIVLTFGGRLGLTAAILVGDVVLARTLGPEGKGAFVLVLALSSLGAVILALGLERSLAVFAARSRDIARRAFANAALWTLVVGILGALAIVTLYCAAAISIAADGGRKRRWRGSGSRFSTTTSSSAPRAARCAHCRRRSIGS